MKNLLKKLGFRKMDEMEQHIAFKSQRYAYIFLMVALLVWTIYESYKVFAFQTMLNPLPCFLLAAAACIQTFSQLVMTRNAVKNDGDSYETSPLFKIIIWICVVCGVIVTVGAAIVIMGVKL